MIPALKEVVGKVSTAEATTRCERAKVSFAPVGKPSDLFADAHLLASRALLDVAIAKAGGGQGPMTKLPNMPFEFGAERQRTTLRSQPPSIGADNAAVLAAAGYTAAEIADMARRGVIVSA